MKKFLKVLVPCIIILALGVAAFLALKRAKVAPAKVKPQEQVLHVRAIDVHPERVPAAVTGYGAVRSLNVVPITAEVAGMVVEVHPRLEVGEIIPKGETLFVVDPRTYEARVSDSKATVDQLRNSVKRLQIQWETDKERLATLERTSVLARKEFERLKGLFDTDQVGTEAGVEQAEQAGNAAQDQVDRMKQALRLYPVQVEEARNALAAAEARLAQNEINLARTRVVAPFDARVKSQMIEAGQYVGPGTPVATLADDSLLEISVPLDSRQARRWLEFDSESASETAWFAQLKPVECAVRWTEDPAHSWTGRVHRVEKFDDRTRTLTVAVRVDGAQVSSKEGGGLPLVDGMFCSVSIPGKVMESVYRLPRSAVSFDGTVWLCSEEGRLRTVPVELVHEQNGEAFVAEGLEPGATVVVTRLVDPLENSLLDIEKVNLEGAAS